MITRVTAAGAGSTTHALRRNHSRTLRHSSMSHQAAFRSRTAQSTHSRKRPRQHRIGHPKYRLWDTRANPVHLASVKAALGRDCRAAAASSTIAVCSAIDVRAHAALIETLDIGIYESAGTLVPRASEHATAEAVESTRRAIGLTPLSGSVSPILLSIPSNWSRSAIHCRPCMCQYWWHNRRHQYSSPDSQTSPVLAGRTVVPRDNSCILTLGLSRRKLRRAEGSLRSPSGQ